MAHNALYQAWGSLLLKSSHTNWFRAKCFSGHVKRPFDSEHTNLQLESSSLFIRCWKSRVKCNPSAFLYLTWLWLWIQSEPAGWRPCLADRFNWKWLICECGEENRRREKVCAWVVVYMEGAVYVFYLCLYSPSLMLVNLFFCTCVFTCLIMSLFACIYVEQLQRSVKR